MKKYITYGVNPVDPVSPLNGDRFYAYVQWFDGTEVIITESGQLTHSDAWKWVGDKLKEIDSENIS